MDDRSGMALRYWSATIVILLLLWASSAPSVLYPLWAGKWDLSPLTVTSIYSGYPVALIAVLLVGGGISDLIGRRRTMLIGMAVIAVACLLMAFAPAPSWLYVARSLQGLGTGLALGASNAAVVESILAGNVARAAATITVASAGGLILGPIVTGALVTYGPVPLHLALLVLTALILGAIALLIAARNAGVRPGDAASPTPATRWRPRAITVPRALLPVFGVAALAVTASYASGALALSLGAQMARDLVETRNALVIGLILAATPVGIGGVALAVRRPPAAVAMLLGGLLSGLGITLLLVTAVTGQLWLFVVSLGIGGIGQGLLNLGGLGLATTHAPAAQRGQTLSAVYLVAYLGQAFTAITVGLLATWLDLHRALDLFAPLMILAGLTSSALALRELRRNAGPVAT